MDLISIFRNKKIIEKANNIFKNIKEERKIDTQDLQLFNVDIKTNEYNSVKELKDNMSTSVSLRPIFDEYYKKNNLYKYIVELNKLGINRNNICKSIVNIKYDVKIISHYVNKSKFL